MKKTLRLLAFALLTVMLCITLASCGGPNPDPDDALAALKDNGVTWAGKDAVVIPLALKALGVDGIDSVVSGTGKIDGEYAHVTIIYFDEKDDANDAWDEVKEMFENDEKDEDAKIVIKKSGKMIYCGTKNAIKAAK